MRLFITKVYIIFLIMLVLPAGCKHREEGKMEHKSNDNRSEMGFAATTEGSKFVAAVKFRRSRVELFRAPGFEKEQNLDAFPSITWWWYEVDLEPEAVIMGSWEIDRIVTLKCCHHVATSTDASWVGIIVRDNSGQVKWLKEYILREGQVFDPDTDALLGTEQGIKDIIEIDCKLHDW